jgi:hypothetical protein
MYRGDLRRRLLSFTPPVASGVTRKLAAEQARSGRNVAGFLVYQAIKDRISSAAQDYPFKRRVLSALTMCAVLLTVTWNWRFEPAKTIAICALTIACLFDRKGRWFMFFFGIAVGNMILYQSSLH